jgi:hypothetical protein
MVAGATDRIASALAQWAGVSSHPHRFGGIEFVIGRREIGHVHGDWLVDIPFPTATRNDLVAAGRADPHHILHDSGWVSVYLHEPDDVARAIDLLRMSYDIAARQKGLASSASSS